MLRIHFQATHNWGQPPQVNLQWVSIFLLKKKNLQEPRLTNPCLNPQAHVYTIWLSASKFWPSLASFKYLRAPCCRLPWNTWLLFSWKHLQCLCSLTFKTMFLLLISRFWPPSPISLPSLLHTHSALWHFPWSSSLCTSLHSASGSPEKRRGDREDEIPQADTARTRATKERRICFRYG